MRIPTMVLVVFTVLSIPFVCVAAVDDEDDQGLKTLAVQNRKQTMTHEFGVSVGTLPLDAFEKGLTFTGDYTIHFTDFLAWEVGQFTYSYRIETDLKDELKNVCSAKATEFEVVQYYATSALVLKPLYGKLALLNRTLLFGEMFIVAGGGYGWMTLTSRPVAVVGGGVRLYAGRFVSFRLDVRDYMFINADDLHNELWVALGISLSFG